MSPSLPYLPIKKKSANQQSSDCPSTRMNRCSFKPASTNPKTVFSDRNPRTPEFLSSAYQLPGNRLPEKLEPLMTIIHRAYMYYSTYPGFS